MLTSKVGYFTKGIGQAQIEAQRLKERTKGVDLLNLSRLRADYKATRKQNWPLASKINILIEAAKLQSQSLSDTTQAGKRIKLLEILQGAKISRRTLQRWQNAYRQFGVDGIAPLKKQSFLFEDQVIAEAIFDRIVSRGTEVILKGDSYRKKHMKNQELKI